MLTNVKKSEVATELSSRPASVGQLFLILATLLLVAIFLFSPSDVFAAGGAHSITPPPFSDFISGLAKFWFNFGLYCFLVFLVARKPIVNGYAARRAAIEDRVLSGARALAAAQSEYQAAERQFAAIDQEIERIQREIKAETTAELATIAQDAQQRAERISQQASDSAAAERRSVEEQVEQELIAAALLLAREKLERGSSQEGDIAVRSAALKLVPQLMQ